MCERVAPFKQCGYVQIGIQRFALFFGLCSPIVVVLTCVIWWVQILELTQGWYLYLRGFVFAIQAFVRFCQCRRQSRAIRTLVACIGLIWALEHSEPIRLLILHYVYHVQLRIDTLTKWEQILAWDQACCIALPSPFFHANVVVNIRVLVGTVENADMRRVDLLFRVDEIGS